MLLDANWYGLNGTRLYPIDDGATGRDDSGVLLPSDILVDASIRFPAMYGNYACLAAVTVTSSIVTVVLQAATGILRPTAAQSAPPSPVYSPLAAISLPQPVTPYISYALTPLLNYVGGWIVFGPGVENAYQGKFSTLAQGALLPRCATFYNSLPVTDIGQQYTANPYGGVVVFNGGSDLSVSIGTRTVNGTPVEAVVIGLNTNLTTDPFEIYSGPCNGRPESGTCSPPGITQINTTSPDSNGNINITWQDLQVYRLATGSGGTAGPGGVVLSLPYQLKDVCAPKSATLPDPVTGALPNTGSDDCVHPLPVNLSQSAPPVMSGMPVMAMVPPPATTTVRFIGAVQNMRVVSGMFSSGATGYAAESLEAENLSVCTLPAAPASLSLSFELPADTHTAAGLLFDYQENGDHALVLVNSATKALEIWRVIAGRQRITRVPLAAAVRGNLKLDVRVGRGPDNVVQLAASVSGSTVGALTWRGDLPKGSFGIAALGGRAVFQELSWEPAA